MRRRRINLRTDEGLDVTPYRGTVFRPVLRSQIVFDVVVAVLLGVVLLVLQAGGGPDWVGVGVVLGLTASLALRRLSPALALLIAWAVAVLQIASWHSPDPANLLIGGVMYTTSAYGSRRVRLAGLFSALGGAMLAAGYIGLQDVQQQQAADFTRPLVQSAQLVLGSFAGVLLILLLPWLAGLVRRTRRLASMSREAQLLAERDAARADRAVAVEQERVRIARDMHDIVAHSLAVVIAQADGARYALKADPAIADQALSTISGTARRALGDVRELLGALRHEQGAAPTPAIDDVDRLVAEMGELGLDVRVAREGDPTGLPTTTQLAVYRIVQESLTNAYKHGQTGSPVRVDLEYGPETVAVRVENRRDDDGRRGPGTGHGLVGMRERATIVGGTMTAGPRGDDFVVAVRMPTVPASGQMPRDRITSIQQERTAR